MAIVRPKLKFIRGKTYVIDQSDTTNAGHPLRFTADSGVSEYTSGVTATGTPGQAGAKTTFAVPGDAPDNLMYYCSTHGINMGQKMKIIGTSAVTYSGGESVSGSSITHGQWRNPTDSTTSNPQIYIRQQVVGGQSQSTAATNLINALNTLQVGDTITVASPAKVFTISGGISTFLDTNTDYRVWLFDVDAQGLTNSTYFYLFTIPSNYSSSSGSGVWYGDRAISTHSDNVQMDYWDITNGTNVNAADFGDTIGGGHYSSGGISNGSRGIFTGGNSNTNVIQYITTSTLGNAIDFGDMTRNNFGTGNTSDNTRGIIAGGANPPSDVGQGWNGIEYITIATTSNGTNFGNLAQSREHSAGASNGTRGAIAGGQSPAAINNIDYVTIQTTANAIDFGDLVVARRFLGGTGNATRATFVGGEISGQGDQMDAVDLSTLGNATDWGDLALERQGLSVTGNADYGTAGGGQTPADAGGSLYDRIDRWSFATSGNATAIGDITSGRAYGGAVSGNAA